MCLRLHSWQLAELGFEPRKLDSTAPAVNCGDCAGTICSPPEPGARPNLLAEPHRRWARLHVSRRALRHAAAALGWAGLVRT